MPGLRPWLGGGEVGFIGGFLPVAGQGFNLICKRVGRAEGSCLDERHCLAGCVYLVDLLLCCCTSSIKAPVSLKLGYRLTILEIRSVALYCCVLARTKARKAASTAAYLDTHHSTAQSSYLNLHSSGRAQLSLVPSTRQHEQHRFSRSSDRRRPKSHRTRHRGRLREGLPAILCLT